MGVLLLVTFVLLVSACYAVAALAVLINLGVLPQPEKNQLAAHLYWRKKERFVASLPMTFYVVHATPATSRALALHYKPVRSLSGTESAILTPGWAVQGGIVAAMSRVSGVPVPGETIFLKVS